MSRHSRRLSRPSYEFDRSARDCSPDPEKDGDVRLHFADAYADLSSPSSSTGSSRVTSGSHQPMLAPLPSPKRKSRNRHRLSNSIMRCLCLALISTVLVLILTLIRMSWVSSRRLENGLVGRPAAAAPWESFPFLERYYGGLRTLVRREENNPEYPRDDNERDSSGQGSDRETAQTKRQMGHLEPSQPFNPYPDYHSDEYLSTYAPVTECFLDDKGAIKIPAIQSYAGVPLGFPDAVLGSNKLLGIRDDVCFERFGRLGPYGYGYGERRGGSSAGLSGDQEGADVVWRDHEKVDFRDVRWAEVQERCNTANFHRFGQKPKPKENRFQSMNLARDPESSNSTIGSDVGVKKTLPRTAVIVRTWWDFEYGEEDIMYLRSLISELALLSGGEYTVHFLIQVKDDNAQIWADDDTYQRILNDALPKEFRGMGTLWSERQMGLIYGGLAESFYRGLPVHGVYRSSFMAMQYFAHQHPEYDYFWNWEMDVRYTGHWYHFFDNVRKWSMQQPRKGLWERNSRFYVPTVHGSWDDFKQMVRVQTEMGTNSRNNLWSGLKTGNSRFPGDAQGTSDKPIWGPERSEDDDLEARDDVNPPTSYEKDKYEWGVGEEADLITFNPLFDPDGTTWILAEDVTGYNTTHGLPPRRAAVITVSRLSRRLLEVMHRETAMKRHSMFSEMWPASVALQHGFKAVYAPHSVYIDRKWPTTYLAAVINGGRNGASGGARTSVFGDREHNFRGTTWYYNAGFAPNLWRRWLGFRVDNAGGEEFEVAGEGRMCLPPMLLHPIKGVKLIIEGRRKDD
ncbi:hypothetical protein MMC16_003749 [Acarospora aff. strigata]|nr:hypothetical protein [Acarospora aff. strigata]